MTDDQTQDILKKVKDEIDAKGGALHFSIALNNHGWFSVCKEFPEIFTGGQNMSPSPDQVLQASLDAFEKAYGIDQIKESHEVLLPLIKLIWAHDGRFSADPRMI